VSAATPSAPTFGEQPTPIVGPPPWLLADPRYRVLGEIGRGGMGVVFDAIDRKTGERVAIKVLTSKRDGLLRFKNEFRLASRLAHPNLVALYDLVITDEIAYFVMEYAAGVDLRKWVRVPGRPPHGPTAANLPRLYACLTQMLEALECLSAAGIVHRDLKPSNVIVSPDGHVKLLDFGLAGSHDTPDFSAAMLAGTPTYMSPEQIEGRPLSPASDLYALGILVYELIVGEPPFVGPQRTVLHAQRHQYPVPPSDRVEGVPPDLELWCLRLLSKKAEERFPTARAARLALEACGAPAGKQVWNEAGSGSYAALGDRKLVGRDSERALLGALLDRTREGACNLALIVGDSGIGKTALAESLLAEAAETGCVVLRGACREHESVTYNAFDAVVDGAASAVERLIAGGKLTREKLAEEAEDLALLGRLFPVLRELHGGLAPASAPPRRELNDRERAFGLVKRLVERVTRTHPLVLLLDDLHWADEDSLALLGHLLTPPTSRRLLVLATSWPQAQGSGALERFLTQQRESPDGGFTQLTLGPLGSSESACVVEAAAQGPLPERTVDVIRREAQGNPFLLVELSRLAVEEGLERPTVEEVTRRRLQLLDDDERVLVELASVAPSPVDAELLQATLDAFSRPLSLESAGLRRLIGLKILRESGARARTLDRVHYDFCHHRIRETIKAGIPETRKRSIHLKLADAILQLRPDPEALVRELTLGGDEKRAAEFAEAAAEAAMSRLAHARAVELYALSLKHAGADERKKHRLHLRLGEALEGTGRYREASEHYAVGLHGSPLTGVRRVHFKLRFANCLMHVGQLEQSGALVERSLADLGHKKRPRFWRLLTVLWLLLRSAFRVLAPRPIRDEDDEETESRLLAYSLAVAHFQFLSRNLAQLEMALRYRLLGLSSPVPEARQEAYAVSLILLIPFQHVGPWVQRRVERIFGLLEANQARQATERGRAWLPILRALYAMIRGRPDEAIGHFDGVGDAPWARSGYVALQRQNAMFLAGAYDRYIDDLTATAHHEGAGLQPLDIARLAYIERLRGHHETARRLLADLVGVQPEDVPWTHRSLFTYQLVELCLYDHDTANAAQLARRLLPRIRKGAVSPTTGAFESLDAVVRAFVAEARRLIAAGERQAGEALVREAERALEQVPLLAPPLFAGRLAHDRGILALARGRRAEALREFEAAYVASSDTVVPCFRMRLLEDLLELYDPKDRRHDAVLAELEQLSDKGRVCRRTSRAPWLHH
jgi:tetratricopeptide (TPR) repeat protein